MRTCEPKMLSNKFTLYKLAYRNLSPEKRAQFKKQKLEVDFLVRSAIQFNQMQKQTRELQISSVKMMIKRQYINNKKELMENEEQNVKCQILSAKQIAVDEMGEKIEKELMRMVREICDVYQLSQEHIGEFYETRENTIMLLNEQDSM
ncbi:Hypothetical_protein [Hexamita inflata]|uniref:Hypothetical_protein n=1 Tax=Hexamita inflata TaxID=28002 RepID=A0AA86PS77_9EUKA|nr:Hypothetical protein HINF_LOCUS30897 [Hexamita inflata]